MFGTDDPTDTLAIAVSLIYSWVFWKAPVILYALHLSKRQESMGLKIGLFVGEAVILLAVDILLTIFVKSFYGDHIFAAAYVILTLIVAIVNNAGVSRIKEAVLNTLIPLLFIAFLYCTYTLFLPRLYYVYYQNLSVTTVAFLVFYLYPAFDLLFYSVFLILRTKVENDVKGFFSVIHYFMVGYGAGMIMIVGYTEV